MEDEIIEFNSLYEVLVTIAHQIGSEKSDFSNKFDVIKSIYEKLSGKTIKASSTNEIVNAIYDLAVSGEIQLAVKPNKLTYDGNVWKFERTPDIGGYVSGDLYVNSNKVGSYNGLICRNTLSGWEEGALAI